MTEDERLKSLFAAPEAPPDAMFVQQVRDRLVLEERLRAARRSAWRRFAAEIAASGAMLVTIANVMGLFEAGVVQGASALSPGTTAILIFMIWTVVALRPAGRSIA